MKSVGATVLDLRQRFGKGLRVAYWRDVVRPRILQSAPITDTTDDTCEIHALTSGADWLNLIWSLKSFYESSGRRYSLCIHEDGSLDAADLRNLETMFPAARVIRRAMADVEILATLKDHSRCRSLRTTNQLSLKIFDFHHYLQARRMLLLDSDLLFFSEPQELLRRIEDPSYRLNSVNPDCGTAYTINLADAASAGIPLIERFNSGLGLIHQDSIQLDWLEEFLSLPGIEGHFWRIEQTLFALCSSRYGVELLPEEYAVRLNGTIRGPVRHYVGIIRHLMYREGMRRLVRENRILTHA